MTKIQRKRQLEKRKNIAACLVVGAMATGALIFCNAMGSTGDNIPEAVEYETSFVPAETEIVEEFEVSCVEVDLVGQALEEDTEVEEVIEEEPEETTANCTPLKKKTKIKNSYVGYCEKVAKKYKNVDAATLIAMIEKETGGKNQQVKHKGSTYQGLTMINPKYQKARMKKLGIKSLMDEYSNILCCADILQENYDTYGSMRLAIIGFNAGEYSTMFKNAKKNGTSTKYCRWVMSRAKELRGK